MDVIETFTLVANLCYHCGCVFVPAIANDSRCPVDRSHSRYVELHLTLARAPEEWMGDQKKIVTKEHTR